LDVDPVLIQQEVACLPAKPGISDHHRRDVSLGREHRHAGLLKTGLRRSHCRALLRALALQDFEVRDRYSGRRGDPRVEGRWKIKLGV
jgi:hypothetical protein